MDVHAARRRRPEAELPRLQLRQRTGPVLREHVPGPVPGAGRGRRARPPSAWVGTPATRAEPQDERLRSADGAYQALPRDPRAVRRGGPGVLQRSRMGDPEAKSTPDHRPRQGLQPPALPDRDRGTWLRPHLRDPRQFSSSGALYAPDGRPARGRPHAHPRACRTPARATLLRPAPRWGRESLAASRGTRRRKATRSADAVPVRQLARGVQRRPVHRRPHPPAPVAGRRRHRPADRRAPYFGRAWAWGRRQCAPTPGPSATRTPTPGRSPGGPRRPCWSSATTGTRRPTTTGPCLVERCCRTAACCPATTGVTPRTAPRPASPPRWTTTCSGDAPPPRARCAPDVQPFTEPLGTAERRAAPDRPLPPVVPPLPGALPRERPRSS